MVVSVRTMVLAVSVRTMVLSVRTMVLVVSVRTMVLSVRTMVISYPKLVVVGGMSVELLVELRAPVRDVTVNIVCQ